MRKGSVRVYLRHEKLNARNEIKEVAKTCVGVGKGGLSIREGDR